MFHPAYGFSLLQLSFTTLLILENFHRNSVVVTCARLGDSLFGDEQKEIQIGRAERVTMNDDLDDAVLRNILNDVDLTNFEYVKETPEKIRIGCTGDLDLNVGVDGDHNPQASGRSKGKMKRVQSLFIRDADGHKELRKLTHASATFRNDSGMLEERKVFLREFPEECFRLLFGSRSRPFGPCPIGPPGRDGNPGKQGSTGLPGLAGTPGTPGRPGKDGTPGRLGRPGDVGPWGDIGSIGDQGVPGVAGLPGATGAAGPDGKDFILVPPPTPTPPPGGADKQ